jgi:hypothetical protein
MTLAQTVGEQGDTEACETPLPWEGDYDYMSTVEEDSRLDRECEQLLGDSDLDDDPFDDWRSLQHSYRSWEYGYGADNGGRAATPVAMCGAARVMSAMSAAQVHEKVAQPAEAAETAKPSQMSRDIPAAKEEKPTTVRVSAGAAATETDEEGRAARKAAYLALLADTRARHHARLAAMKQRLRFLAARLRRLWQDVGSARRLAPAKGHLRVTATVEKQLEKAEVLLRLTKDYLVPTEEYLIQAEAHLRLAREHLEAAETQLAPAEAPSMSTVKTVAGVLHAGEPVEGHRRQGGRQGVQAGPAADGKGGPQEVVRTMRHDQVPVRGPLKGKVLSLQKQAWCPPGELGERQRRHRHPQKRGVGGATAQDADMAVPRDTPAE